MARLRLLPILLAAGGLIAAGTAAAQASRARGPLQFADFVVGQSLASLAEAARQMDGILVCKRSRTDPSLRECRAEMHDSAGQPVSLWLSAVDSNASITTIEARLSTTELLRWQGGLLGRFGRARERSRGPQHSLQWIRANTMMRLTWRPEGGKVAASVSLIDGARLDAWGRRIEQRLLPKAVAADSAHRDSLPTSSP